MIARPRLLLALALVLAAVAAGCGGSGEKGPTSQKTTAETEGLYLTTSGVTYQIQLSRELNPADVEDREYLEGLPAGTRPLASDETWYAVFLRAKNETERPHRMATEFSIRDTQDAEYKPIPVDPQNPFAYRAEMLQPRAVFPDEGSVNGLGPIKGGLVLFRLKTNTLYNRPLELHMRGPEPDSARVTYDLDV